jgi:hypothetical protein
MLSVAALGTRASVWPTPAVYNPYATGGYCRLPMLRFLLKREAQCSVADTSMTTIKRCSLWMRWVFGCLGGQRRLWVGVVSISYRRILLTGDVALLSKYVAQCSAADTSKTTIKRCSLWLRWVSEFLCGQRRLWVGVVSIGWRRMV